MTKLLYQTDSYLKEFDATITQIDQATNAVALDAQRFLSRWWWTAT